MSCIHIVVVKVTMVEHVLQKSATPEVRDREGSLENPIKFAEYEDKISTGDLAILKRAGDDVVNFAVFVQHEECDPTFPLLLVKGKTKPLNKFDPAVKRHSHPVTAANRIFYGDYEMVSVRSLAPSPSPSLNCHDFLRIAEEVPEIAFTDTEIKAINGAKSPEERSSILCTYMIAHLYNKIGLLKTDPDNITPANLESNLSLSDPVYIKLPPVKEGPLTHGDPPFLSKLV